jgi:hypothetical protein
MRRLDIVEISRLEELGIWKQRFIDECRFGSLATVVVGSYESARVGEVGRELELRKVGEVARWYFSVRGGKWTPKSGWQSWMAEFIGPDNY